MQIQRLFALFAVAIAAEVAFAELARIRLTQHGLDYAGGVVTGILQSEPQLQPGAQLANGQDGKASYSAKMNHFTAPNLRLVSVAPNKLRFESSGGRVEVGFNGKWRQNRILKVSISGTASASSINMGLEVGMTKTNTGQLHLTPGACSVHLGGLSVKLGGGILGKIVSSVINIFKSYAQREINSKVCQAMNKIILERGNPWLASADMSINVRENTKLELLLAADPVMTPAYFDVSFNGGIKEGAEATVPINAAPIPPSDSTANQVYFWLSAAAANGAFDFSHKKGLLQYLVTKEDLSEKHREKLQTTCDGGILPPKCIGAVMPKIAEVYPDTSVYVNIKSREAPTIAIEDGKATIQLKAELAVNVENPKDAAVFKSHLDFKATVAVRVEKIGYQYFLIGELLPKSGEIKLDIVESQIGGIVDNLLKALIEFGEPILLEYFNEQLKKGYALPDVANVELVTPNLGFESGALRVEASVIYKP